MEEAMQEEWDVKVSIQSIICQETQHLLIGTNEARLRVMCDPLDRLLHHPL